MELLPRITVVHLMVLLSYMAVVRPMRQARPILRHLMVQPQLMQVHLMEAHRLRVILAALQARTHLRLLMGQLQLQLMALPRMKPHQLMEVHYHMGQRILTGRRVHTALRTLTALQVPTALQYSASQLQPMGLHLTQPDRLMERLYHVAQQAPTSPHHLMGQHQLMDRHQLMELQLTKPQLKQLGQPTERRHHTAQPQPTRLHRMDQLHPMG